MVIVVLNLWRNSHCVRVCSKKKKKKEKKELQAEWMFARHEILHPTSIQHSTKLLFFIYYLSIPFTAFLNFQSDWMHPKTEITITILGAPVVNPVTSRDKNNKISSCVISSPFIFHWKRARLLNFISLFSISSAAISRIRQRQYNGSKWNARGFCFKRVGRREIVDRQASPTARLNPPQETRTDFARTSSCIQLTACFQTSHSSPNAWRYGECVQLFYCYSLSL